MEISFISKVLRTECENEEVAVEKYGTEVAIKLRDRLADLAAARSVLDLVVGKPKEVVANVPTYVVELINDFQLRFCANKEPLPLLSDEKVNWSKVNRIKLISISQNTNE